MAPGHYLSKWLWGMASLGLHNELTHWGRVTHICVVKLAIIGSDNCLLPGRCQAIIWTNAGILLIGPFSEILCGIQISSFKKMHLKILSAKWHPFCLCLNVLKLINSLAAVICDYNFISLRTSDAILRMELVRDWARYCLVACLLPSRYLNLCRVIVNWNLLNKFQLNFNPKTQIFSQGKAFEKAICKVVAILFWSKCVIFHVNAWRLSSYVNFGSGNGLVTPGSKPLPQTMLVSSRMPDHEARISWLMSLQSICCHLMMQKFAIIGSGNGLSTIRCLDITWTNDDLFSLYWTLKNKIHFLSRD